MVGKFNKKALSLEIYTEHHVRTFRFLYGEWTRGFADIIDRP